MVSDYHNMHVSKFSKYYDFHVSMIWQQKGPLYEAGPCTQKHYQELPVPGIRQGACGHDHAVLVGGHFRPLPGVDQVVGMLAVGC